MALYQDSLDQQWKEDEELIPSLLFEERERDRELPSTISSP